MANIDLNTPETRQQIAGIAALLGAVSGGIVAYTPDGNPLIGIALGFFVSMALALFNRGIGITIIIFSALIILGKCANNT
jgi:hypothetical protein